MKVQVEKSEVFNKWFSKIKNKETQSIIGMHIDRMKDGNLGKVRNVGGHVFEKKIYFGAGYRLYFLNENGSLIILLCGGDKSTQEKDIKLAQKMAKE
jgi:putative addiction module killer protein